MERLFKSELRPLVRPSSVALVGVSGSRDPTNITLTPLLYLKKYASDVKVYPVNPKYKEIEGFPCYPSLLAVPEEVETVLVLVPAQQVPGLLTECVEKGVKAVIVTTSGYAETGPEGKRNQELLAEIAEKNRILLLGPNCNGVVNVLEKIPLGFSPALEGEPLKAGAIGFASQSGATMSALASQGKMDGLGFSYLISTGNEASIDVCDAIKFMVDDKETRVILALIEAINDGRKFLQVAEYALALKKPIVALKIGRTEMASKAVLSHTGKMAGSFPVYQGAFRQKGVLLAEDVDDFLSMAAHLSRFPLPEGRGLGILSTSGGAAELAADKAIEFGLSVPELSLETCQKLSTRLRWFGTAKNPFDFAGQVLRDEAIFNHVAETLASDEKIDALLFAMTSILVDERLINDYVQLAQRLPLPFAFLWLSGAMGAKERRVLEENSIPISKSVDESVRGLKALSDYGAYLRQREASPGRVEEAETYPSSWKIPGRGSLTERESKELLAQWGIPVTREGLARTSDEAVALARSLGYPVALKIESSEVIHKSDIGAVRLNLTDDQQVAEAFSQILEAVRLNQPQAQVRGVLVQEMVRGGQEVIIGLARDPQFGLVIMFGLGGLLTELLRDVTFRVLPITRMDGEEMIKEVKGFRLLQGFRGGPRADLQALVKVMLQVSRFGQDLSDRLLEMDINPLILLPEGQGARVVDATVILKQE